ncbi:MAG: hypothetical protein Q7S98_00530 [Deltaproteobacteria bacterium]|nr:hypothetical protein [Deltaproteobacteria bacterium]
MSLSRFSLGWFLIVLLASSLSTDLAQAGSCPNWGRAFQRNRGEGLPPKGKTMMVFSFANQSQKKSEEWLSEAFRMVLSDYFSFSKNTTVLAPELGKRYQATETPEALEIGKKEKAENIVYGFFEHQGSNLTIYVRFVDGMKGEELGREHWTIEFPETQKIFDLFVEIADRASKVFKKVKTERKMMLAYKHETRSAGAFQSYILGRLHLEAGSPSDIEAALDLFKDAISRDYNYAMAYLGHAEALLMKAAIKKVAGESDRLLVEEATRDLKKASLLHPHLVAKKGQIVKNYLEADVHQTAGATLKREGKKGNKDEFKKALELLPGDIFSLSQLPSSQLLHELDPCAQ